MGTKRKVSPTSQVECTWMLSTTAAAGFTSAAPRLWDTPSAGWLCGAWAEARNLNRPFELQRVSPERRRHTLILLLRRQTRRTVIDNAHPYRGRREQLRRLHQPKTRYRHQLPQRTKCG